MFKFKQFEIDDNGATMKVGTDAVLLGAIAETSNKARILDIGTGCGLIALMLAQRSHNTSIDAVEIDKTSVSLAKKNFENSPWNQQLSIFETSIQDFSQQTQQKYDLIVSNPPFFSNSLKCPNKQRTLARHTDTLPFDDLLEAVNQLLMPQGSFSAILPCPEAEIFINRAQKFNLYPTTIVKIYNRLQQKQVRTIFTLQHIKIDCRYKVLSIRNEDNTYTQEYLDLTKDFYIFIR